MNRPVEHVGAANQKRAPQWAVCSIKTVLAGCAVVVSVWAGCPWPGSVGLALVGIVAVASELSWLGLRGTTGKLALAFVCALSAVVPATPLLAAEARFTLNDFARYYQAVLAWLVAMSLVPVRFTAGRPRQLRLVAVACALLGVGLWLAGAWSQNRRGVFYLGLGVTFALLILLQLWFRLPGAAMLTANTLLLLIVALGVGDLFVSPPPRLNPQVAMARKYYTYEFARRDPQGFTCWWNYCTEQWQRMLKDIVALDRGRTPSFHLRPGSRSRVFECPIEINHLGFRGREVAREKGNAYRIVALGESTTFGHTLEPSHRPWPELLEQIIRERLQPRRPVEVINAGVPGYTLEDNLARLARDILPLKPDLIISYHGYNGFPLLMEGALPVVSTEPPPTFQLRPLRLLAKCEFRLKMFGHRRRHTANPASPPPNLANLMDTRYALAYRGLVQAARTNGIRLVLANYAMAVNSRSDADVVEFYRTGTPMTRWPVEANQAHSALVQEIVRQNPGVCLVDTHPGLDGVHERFIDLVHFTQEGRQHLAETFFAAIRTIVEEDLARF